MNMTDLEADLMIEKARADALQKERDAAIAMLKEIGSCMHCAYNEQAMPCPPALRCCDCSHGCPCRGCGGGENWKWKGVKI